MSTTKIPTKEIPSIQMNVAEVKMANKAWQICASFKFFEAYGYRFESIIRTIQTSPLFKYSTIKRGKIMAIDIMARHVKSHTPKRFDWFMKELFDILDLEDLSLVEIPNRGPEDVDHGYAYEFFPINWNWLWKTTNQFHQPLGRRVA